MTATRRKRLLLGGLVLSLGAAALFGVLMLFEGSLIFFPSPFPTAGWPPQEPGVTLRELTLTAEDGQSLHAVYGSAPEADPTRPVLLFCHGNAGNLADRYFMLRELVPFADVLLFDYRGYGKNTGSPSESGLYADAQAAWSWLTTEQGVAPSRIVLLGRSLGGGPAAELATRVPAAGLILDSTFTSIPAMAKRLSPWIPGFLVRTKFDTLSKLPRITCPVLVIHSKADEVIPFAMGKALYETASEPKTWLELEGAGHNETLHVGGQRYLAALRDFSRACAPAPAK
ncbi:MAG: alpha/beta hydrolase [Planctomycetes bacterium]|nr:alpha/beta hydrolase [Planctomycetota bacterium]